MIARLLMRDHRKLPTFPIFLSISFFFPLLFPFVTSLDRTEIHISWNRKGSFPDQYFTLRSTYLQGRPPKSVNMHWRRFAVSEIPLDDQKEFEAWLVARWAEKDQLLEEYHETGKFPTDLEDSISGGESADQKAVASAGYAEADVRLVHWTEVGQIFGVLAAVASLFKLLPKLWSSRT